MSSAEFICRHKILCHETGEIKESEVYTFNSPLHYIESVAILNRQADKYKLTYLLDMKAIEEIKKELEKK